MDDTALDLGAREDRLNRILETGQAIDTGDKDDDADLRKMREFVAIPIVAIVFLSIFGAPVLIVIIIGIFALMGSRMRQRTLKAETGQGSSRNAWRGRRLGDDLMTMVMTMVKTTMPSGWYSLSTWPRSV